MLKIYLTLSLTVVPLTTLAARDLGIFDAELKLYYLPRNSARQDFKYLTKEVKLPTSQIAFVMVDIWQSNGTNQAVIKVEKFLKRARTAGVLIVHSPGEEVAGQFSRYNRLRQRVRTFEKNDVNLARQVFGESFNESRAKWPPEKRKKLLHVDRPTPPPRVKIHSKVRPLPDEPIVARINELKYLLWKNNVDTIIFAGGAINECLLHRDTGINRLAGSNQTRSNYTIIVLRDGITGAKPSVNHSNEVIKEVFYDYLLTKLAFGAHSEEVQFKPTNPRL